jgi:hypothetical protein
MDDDSKWSGMVGQIARNWAADKYRRDRKFHTQVFYEVIEKYVEVRSAETGENETIVVAEAADCFACSVETVWRALRHVRKMRGTVTKGVS